MNKQEIITEVIEKNEKFKTIRFNTLKNEIEVEGSKILSFHYEELYNICKDELKDLKFTKSDIKYIIEKYAHEHKYTPKTPEKSDWYAKLEFSKDGKPKNTLSNTLTFLSEYPLYKGKFSFNEFTQMECYNDKEVDDHVINEICEVHDKLLGFSSFDRINQAVSTLCYKNKYNPFKKAIENIVWDGQLRAARLFIDKIGAEDTELNASMTEKWLYALIKRLYEPGCPFDTMLITYDKEQGTGKTKIVERLVQCLGIHYGVDKTITYDLSSKDIVDKLNKAWIVSIDELSSFLKAEPEKSKTFISSTQDNARLSYARRSQTFDRHCVFYGSSNIEYFLKDYTSDFERRYWILDCHGTRHDSTWWSENLSDEYLQQVLAEMYYKYRTNKDFNYNSLSIEQEDELRKVQLRHKTLNADDILVYAIKDIMKTKYSGECFDSYDHFVSVVQGSPIPVNTDVFDEVTGKDIENSLNSQFYDNQQCITKIPVTWLKMYLLTIPVMKYRRDISTQYLTSIMRTIGYTYKVSRYNGKPQNCYVKL